MPSEICRVLSVSGRHNDGRHAKLFLISDLYRVVTEIAEVHADIARSFLTCIILKKDQQVGCLPAGIVE